MQVDAPAEDNENNEEETYSIDNPTIDLDFYANSYTGLAKLHRLIFIADHCPSLRLEALKMAINYVMSTYNVTLYQHLHRKVGNLKKFKLIFFVILHAQARTIYTHSPAS